MGSDRIEPIKHNKVRDPFALPDGIGFNKYQHKVGNTHHHRDGEPDPRIEAPSQVELKLRKEWERILEAPQLEAPQSELQYEAPQLEAPVEIQYEAPQLEAPVEIQYEAPQLEAPVEIQYEAPQLEAPVEIQYEAPQLEAPV